MVRFVRGSIQSRSGVRPNKGCAREQRADALLHGERNVCGMRKSAAGSLRADHEISRGGVGGGAENQRGAGARGDAEGTGRIGRNASRKTSESHLHRAREPILASHRNVYWCAGGTLRKGQRARGESDREILWRRRRRLKGRATAAASKTNQ